MSVTVWREYAEGIPDIVREGCECPEMIRLRSVGMNCGCEYTSFPLFREMKEYYSRYDHSLGTALLVWRFTEDSAQTLAALFHDIATPCFAHVVDFMRGDHMTQESTEERTGEIIAGSESIWRLLRKYGLGAEDVADYHRYPVADNDSPGLSADRLEYTLGNLLNFGRRTREEIRRTVEDLTVGRNGRGEAELTFRSYDRALDFARGALEMGEVYVSDEDRFSMQALAELLRDAVRDGAIETGDLWKDEPFVIRKLQASEEYRKRWERFRACGRILRGEADGIVVRAKKRYIDPPVEGRGRLSGLDEGFREQVKAFLARSQEERLSGAAPE